MQGVQRPGIDRDAFAQRFSDDAVEPGPASVPPKKSPARITTVRTPDPAASRSCCSISTRCGPCVCVAVCGVSSTSNCGMRLPKL
jgi:hypothetical protein